MKLVSVIIPTYGGGGYLHTTINSVIEQDYPHIEIIVVDDNGKGTPAQRKTQMELKHLNPQVRSPREETLYNAPKK